VLKRRKLTGFEVRKGSFGALKRDLRMTKKGVVRLTNGGCQAEKQQILRCAQDDKKGGWNDKQVSC
jgi:hypothetical protein